MTGTPQLPQRIVRLAPLAEVLSALGRIVPVSAQELGVQAAAGRVLAQDVEMPAMRPALAMALRDGYAVRSDWSLDASSYAPAPLPAPPARLDVGETLPEGIDAVAPFDAIEIDAAQARIVQTVAPGDGILPAGADGKAGQPLLRAGTRLGATQAAALAASGIARVSVRTPSIRLVTARADKSDTILAIMDMIERDIAAQGGSARTDAAALDVALAAADSDAVIAVGGTGSGRRDDAITSLAKAGEVAFHGIGISPGETVAFGLAAARPVLLLPGRIDSALSAWLTIGRPLLARLAGTPDDERSMPATLTRKIASTIGLAEVIPVRCENGEAEPLASGYWPLHALARASGWVLVPAGSEGYPAGSRVDVKELP